MRILFMVGTHHKSFSRLIDWADRYQQKYSSVENNKDLVQSTIEANRLKPGNASKDNSISTDNNPLTQNHSEPGENLDIQVQYGTSPQPKYARGQENYTHAEMDQLADTLNAIVLPAGPSLMMEWVRRGYKPIIVPRDPALDEHIDEHQLKFAASMEKTGLITLCHSYTELEHALEQIKADPAKGKATENLLQKFDREHSIKNFTQLMEKLLTVADR